MKTILLLSFLSHLLFASPSQIIVGCFLNEANAKIVQEKLDNYLDEEKKFFYDNEISSNSKFSEKYFIVTLEPIFTQKDLYTSLERIRTEFPDAYVLDLDIPLDEIETAVGIEKPEINEAIKEENLAQTTAKSEQKNVKQEISQQPKKQTPPPLTTPQPIKDKPMNPVEDFLFEIVALLVVIVLIIIMILRRRKSNEKESTNEQQEIKEIVVEENISSQEQKKENHFSHEVDFDGKEEGSFENKQANTQNSSPSKIAKVKKRDVPPHGKVTKQSFQEFSGLKLLVAEDNVINQKVITGLLAGTGVEVVIADDGIIALEILEKDNSFPIVVMDAHMPRMDGFEATRAIRANPKYDNVVVVALSGDTAIDDIKKMADAGMQEHLEKPLRMDSLYDVLYAYTGVQENNDNEHINVIHTKELNGDKGLEICGGDESFYRDILNEFIQTYENSTDDLHILLTQDKLNEADKILLDIIGVTANIGADPLNQIAHDIKEALKDTEEKSYLTLIEEYKEHLSLLIKDIKEYL